LLEQVQAARGVTCRLEGDAAPQALLGAGDATHLYRIAQEAVNNAIQHGGARNLQVTLTQDERFVEVQVDDDGRGFDPATEPAGLGLRLMNYRSRLMGGRLAITRRAAGGMSVRCWVPTRAAVARIAAAPGRT
jgi:signal transduction histidine kinase